jgi:hypothetical protein
MLQLGMNDPQMAKKIFIDDKDVSDESILWDFPERVDQLHDEIKQLIMGNVVVNENVNANNDVNNDVNPVDNIDSTDNTDLKGCN